MAISLNTIRELQALILSDRCTYKGSEVPQVSNLVAALAEEESRLVMAGRMVPVPPRAKEVGE